MQTLRRAVTLGLAFGLAAATLEGWLNLLPFIERRFGPGPPFAKVAAFEIALGALLGLLAAPLLRLRAGTLLHVAAVALGGWGLERWVAVDSPLFARLEVLPPVGGALLVLLGLALARLRPWLPWAMGAIALGAATAAPQLYLVLDTVRAANVSAYGYARATAPELDALAREGALFLDATSPST